MNDLIKILEKKNITYKLTPFGKNVFTCEDVAQSIGIQPKQVAKTMVLKCSDNSCILAVLAGNKRLNIQAVTNATNNKKVSLAKPNEVASLTGLPLGAVTPLLAVQKPKINIILDSELIDEPVVNISSGELDSGINISPKDLIKIIKPIIYSISI
jgi:Cys-tRNA(Pro) deacylase